MAGLTASAVRDGRPWRSNVKRGHIRAMRHFLQRDPLDRTIVPLHHNQSDYVLQYADGATLYQYLRSNPLVLTDWVGECASSDNHLPTAPLPPTSPPGTPPIYWLPCSDPIFGGALFLIQCTAGGGPNIFAPPGSPCGNGSSNEDPCDSPVCACGVHHEEQHLIDIPITGCTPGMCLAVDSSIRDWLECRGYEAERQCLLCMEGACCTSLTTRLGTVNTQIANYCN